jgi:hypothetical protein
LLFLFSLLGQQRFTGRKPSFATSALYVYQTISLHSKAETSLRNWAKVWFDPFGCPFGKKMNEQKRAYIWFDP